MTSGRRNRAKRAATTAVMGTAASGNGVARASATAAVTKPGSRRQEQRRGNQR
jgi:hypothetical protein